MQIPQASSTSAETLGSPHIQSLGIVPLCLTGTMPKEGGRANGPILQKGQLKHRWPGVDPQAPLNLSLKSAGSHLYHLPPPPILRSPRCLGEGGHMLRYTGGERELVVPVADVRSLPHAQ